MVVTKLLPKPIMCISMNNRQQIRRGIKMVLEDRISQVNASGDVAPLFSTLNYLHFDYQDGFIVTFLIDGSVLIDGVLYNGKDEVTFVKDNEMVLYVIYRDRLTKDYCLYQNVYAL